MKTLLLIPTTRQVNIDNLAQNVAQLLDASVLNIPSHHELGDAISQGG